MDFNTWWNWAISYEPTLSTISISPTIPGILTDSYNESVDKCKGVIGYLSDNNYTLLVYRYALHILITNSNNSNIVQLKNLYNNYQINSYAGIIQSAGDSSSSASKLITNGLQAGDANTLLLWATPYGKLVEEVFEQLKNIAIVV